MGWAAKERPAGPPTEPGSIRKDRNAEEVSAARALRPGAAGLEGSDAHPIEAVQRPKMRSGRRSPGPISAAWERHKSASADLRFGVDTPSGALRGRLCKNSFV